MGWEISPSIPKFFKAALGSTSIEADPLIVLGSAAVLFCDIHRIAADCRRSSVSITDRNGFGVGVPRLFSTIIPIASSSIQAARMSASIFTISLTRSGPYPASLTSYGRGWTDGKLSAQRHCAAALQPVMGCGYWCHQQILPPQMSRCSCLIVFS